MTTTTPPNVQTESASERSPFEDSAARVTNLHGACSIETFASASGLSKTHEDADGFAQYLNRVAPANFRFRDAGVKYWEYAEPYDDWQGLYGSDAVAVFYHSGHGTMDGAGVFHAPLGAAWDGKDWIASTQINWGNERLRYAFWSTCLSLRVHDGHSPYRTWAASAKGVRMLFGWETVSWDVDVYGRRFWDHWNAGKSFSGAWLAAGWDGGHDQAPSACGMGATEAEAKARVFGERAINFSAVSSNWWWWTWLDAARSITESSALGAEAPDHTVSVQWGDFDAAAAQLASVGPTSRVGHRACVELASETSAVRRSTVELSAASVAQAAADVVAALDLDGIDVVPHLVRTQRAAGGRSDGTDDVAAHVAGYSVEYRQTVEGVRVISPDSGYVRVHLDAEGRPLSADVTTRPVRSTQTRPRLAAPDSAGVGGSVSTVGALLTGAAAGHPGIGDAAEVLPDTREIGLITDGAIAYHGAQQGYLVSAGHGLEKKVRVTVPLDRQE